MQANPSSFVEHALPHLPFAGLFHCGLQKPRLRSGRAGFFCHRQRRRLRLPLPMKKPLPSEWLFYFREPSYAVSAWKYAAAAGR